MLVLCTKCVNKNSYQYIDNIEAKIVTNILTILIAIEENGKYIVKSCEEKKNK